MRMIVSSLRFAPLAISLARATPTAVPPRPYSSRQASPRSASSLAPCGGVRSAALPLASAGVPPVGSPVVAETSAPPSTDFDRSARIRSIASRYRCAFSLISSSTISSSSISSSSSSSSSISSSSGSSISCTGIGALGIIGIGCGLPSTFCSSGNGFKPNA